MQLLQYLLDLFKDFVMKFGILLEELPPDVVQKIEKAAYIALFLLLISIGIFGLKFFRVFFALYGIGFASFIGWFFNFPPLGYFLALVLAIFCFYYPREMFIGFGSVNTFLFAFLLYLRNTSGFLALHETILPAIFVAALPTVLYGILAYFLFPGMVVTFTSYLGGLGTSLLLLVPLLERLINQFDFDNIPILSMILLCIIFLFPIAVSFGFFCIQLRTGFHSKFRSFDWKNLLSPRKQE